MIKQGATNVKIKPELCKAYSKRFKNISKDFFVDNSTGILIFVEYLRYLRDLRIISATKDIYTDAQEKFCLASLLAALAEFDAWRSCSDDQKQFHWNSFMELTKQNFGEWITLNDTV